jgi:transcriptional regulator with XRE-family HTH domain
MPRKPKFNHPLRVCRQAAGMTQPQLAVGVGCSKVTIQKIENGDLALSPKLAWRLEHAIGANGSELVKGKKGKALDRFGNPFTTQSFQRHKNSGFSFSRTNMLDAVDLVLKAACQPGGKLRPVFHSLCEWLQSTRDGFKLGPHIDALLKQRKRKDSATMTYGEWRKNPLAEYYGFKDDKKKPASEPLTMETEAWPMWNPGSDML